MKMFSVKWIRAVMFLSSVRVPYSSGVKWPFVRLHGQQCFECGEGFCEKPTVRQCPGEQPFCATAARYPNFTSYLTCAVSLTWRPCSLMFLRDQDYYQMTCMCTTPLCNSPFTTELRDELIKFTSDGLHSNSSELTSEFWLLRSRFAEFDAENLYGNITKGVRGDPKNVIHESDIENAIHEDSDGWAEGRARRLERSPSDDEEEDEGQEEEGSGQPEAGAPPALSSPQPPPPTTPAAAAIFHSTCISIACCLFLLATKL